MTIWVLTEEYNDYYQHGEYFLEAWDHKPTREELIAATVEPQRVEHVLAGGGRCKGPGRYYDEQWYYLKEQL
jgi:hypothetical protein